MTIRVSCCPAMKSWLSPITKIDDVMSLSAARAATGLAANPIGGLQIWKADIWWVDSASITFAVVFAAPGCRGRSMTDGTRFPGIARR